MSGITRDDWLRAMEDARLVVESDDSALTAQECAAMFGIDRQAAIRRMKVLEREGKAIRTRKRLPDSNGHMVFWNAWRLVQPQKKRR